MSTRYLLGRYMDPMLGVFTGILAYHLHESNPRSRPEPGHRLNELVAWQWNQSKEARRAKEESLSRRFGAAEEAELERLRRELTGVTVGEK
ncbi:hypothetical protein NliqN6_0985 [Naganishia liquefaciens]|uniref:Uncharacterized protein n=1 Tax=Naganishia liquefaciens TaxID=104408 RepID=A0A8H3TP37_9TREE|nr:hypothetical protein NliqN6_0985 [Naganishia liquefaciens]